MMMTTPRPGQALTAETVKLLVKGDVTQRIDGRVSIHGLEHEGGLSGTYLDGTTHANSPPSHFTFIGRPDASGWIAWSGGDNPLPGSLVEVRYHGEREVITGSDVQDWTWLHETVRDENDIIAFRLASQSTAPTMGKILSDQLHDRRRYLNPANAPTRGEGERFASLSLDRGAYPDDLIDHLNGYITGGSGRCREGLEGMGVIIDAPTPPEPVASGYPTTPAAMAEADRIVEERDGEGLEVVAYRVKHPKHDAYRLCFFPAASDIAEPLVTAEAAAARIEALNAEVERWISAYKIAHDQATQNGQRATQAEARADRLGEALEPFAREADGWPELADDDTLALTTPDGTSSAYDLTVRDIRRAAEALREPKSGGGE